MDYLQHRLKGLQALDFDRPFVTAFKALRESPG